MDKYFVITAIRENISTDMPTVDDIKFYTGNTISLDGTIYPILDSDFSKAKKYDFRINAFSDMPISKYENVGYRLSIADVIET